MPKSPAWARRYNHWIDNDFLGDAPPGLWLGYEILTGLTP
jgi:hypothetical protein